MPKRSNEFQQIIFMIQKQLAAQAIVTESKILRDTRSGASVEVDIVIDHSVGGISIAIGIECTATSRPATVEWVREMVGKHQDLPLDKAILVSKSGFTEEAKKKASAHGVEAITLETAEHLDWQGVVHRIINLRIGRFQFKLLGGSIEYDQTSMGDQALLISPTMILFQEGLNKPLTLESYATGVLSMPDVGFKIIKQWLDLPKNKRKNDFEFTLNCEPMNEITTEYQPGHFVTIPKLIIRAKATVDSTPVELQLGKYLGEKVAYGSAENIFPESSAPTEKVLITFLEKDGKLDSGSMMIPKFKGKAKRVLPLKIAQRKAGKDTR